MLYVYIYRVGNCTAVEDAGIAHVSEDSQRGTKFSWLKRDVFFSGIRALKTHDLGIWTLFFLAFVPGN